MCINQIHSFLLVQVLSPCARVPPPVQQLRTVAVVRQGVHEVLAVGSSPPVGVGEASSTLPGSGSASTPSGRLNEAELKQRAEGSLATPVYVPETRAQTPPSVQKPPTARGDEEAYQSAIKQRAAKGEALTPDQIYRRAKAAGSLAV
jgi:hypothetical protein